MKHEGVRWAVAVALASAAVMPAVFAADETAQKALPTLLIKGDVVSVDTNDPTTALLKVKDRYGFETPIYLTQEAKITKGDQTLAVADLKAGTPVEVEYNFDINTAKRHATTVKISQPAASASASPSSSTASSAVTVSPAAPAPVAASAAVTPPSTPAPAAPAQAAGQTNSEPPAKSSTTP